MTLRGGSSAGLAVALAALLSLPLASCGQRTLDNAELESTLKRQLDSSAGVTSRSVACPDDITAEQGRRFDCKLVAPNGDQVRVEVQLTNDQGGFNAEVPPEQFR